MGEIQVMSPALANQIAAGEVLERPASCVKELVENSLDAGARQIQVAIEEGGIRAIIVQDDGCGMDASDAVQAFARHATSKLRHARDLQRIATLGFRGEALASIAAVAKVRLDTRQAHSEGGISVRVEASETASPAVPMGMPHGTRIEVRDLFFNTPARLKYLRSVQTEQARCAEVVQRAALSRPDVAFRLDIDGHTSFLTPGRGDLLDVAAAILGVGEAGQMIAIDHVTSDYRVRGFIGRPVQARSHRGRGYWFVNQRPIRNAALHQAVVAGYGSRLMVNRHPVYVLMLDMDPGLVDVNIHPHKAEVRFSEERDICQLVTAAVRAGLDDVLLIPAISPTQQRMVLPSERVRPAQRDQISLFTERPWSVPATVRETSATHLQPDLAKGTEIALQPATAPVLERQTAAPTGQGDTPPAPADTELRPTVWSLRPIGQALGMYVIADDGDHLYIIDQHAAHERILYERFSARMERRDVQRLPLLTPVVLHLTPTQHVQLMAQRDTWDEVGLAFDEFGGYAIALRTIPDVWEGLDAAALCEEVLTTTRADTRSADLPRALRDAIVLKACKAAIKANHYLSDIEMAALCEALSALQDPFHCPHGRPVFLQMDRRHLERSFGRLG